NILPTLLHRKAQLLRDWSTGPLGMMEGIDREFDVAMFVGYHAKAGTSDAPLNHTFTGSLYDVRVNGISLPEAGWNALIAGHYNVPVIFASGDKALCEQVAALIDSIVTVPVKEGIGKASLSLHPEEAQDRIKQGVAQALKHPESKPYRIDPPFTLEVSFTTEAPAWKAQWYPGAQLIDGRTVRFQSDDFFECLRCMHFL
ncbi:MAG: M55 family metallopeptidase, partial [Candidatus Heimdallarchaeota archaeon]